MYLPLKHGIAMLVSGGVVQIYILLKRSCNLERDLDLNSRSDLSLRQISTKMLQPIVVAYYPRNYLKEVLHGICLPKTFNLPPIKQSTCNIKRLLQVIEAY